MPLRSDRVQLDPDAVLRCPQCGGAYLHHRSVEVFHRVEDASTGVHVQVEGPQVQINDDLTGNPSARRTGLLLRFACELCAAEPLLMVAQHKGMTLMQWHVDLAGMYNNCVVNFCT